MMISHAPWLHWPETKALIAACEQGGITLRFVGGCVRDTLLGRDVQEVDAATPSTPDQVTRVLEASGIRVIPTGIDHGTVTALIGAQPFEITTLRRDTACDGRHAIVEYTDDWAQDAVRRDFTINALFADTTGEVWDYVGGLDDIKTRQLRFIGDADARIQEDALRILRYFRFLAQLGIANPDAAALAACRKGAALLAQLSGERIAQEMRKLLSVPALKHDVLYAMQQAELLAYLHLPQPPDAMANLIYIEAAERVDIDWRRRLACWLRSHDAQALCARWHLSNADEKMVVYVAAATLPAATLSVREQKQWLRRVGRIIFRDKVLLAWAYDTEHAGAYVAMLVMAELWQIPVFPVKGADLLERGFASGPALGTELKRLEALWEAADYQPSAAELLAKVEGHG